MSSLTRRSTPKTIVLGACLFTAAYLLTRIDWHHALASNREGEAFGSYVVALIIALLPYSALWRFLSGQGISKRAKFFSVATVAGIPLVAYPYYLTLGEPTGGWDVFIVCFWQAISIAVLYFTGILKPNEDSETDT